MNTYKCIGDNIKIYTFTRLQMTMVASCIIMLGLIVAMYTCDAIQTNATPATNEVMVLDAGHGAPEDCICLTCFLRM